jgi:hypothetical protein
MTTFELLALLPPFLSVKYRGRVYENLHPTIYANGSRVNISYCLGRVELLLVERIDNQEDLEDFVKDIASEFSAFKIYETDKLFIDN